MKRKFLWLIRKFSQDTKLYHKLIVAIILMIVLPLLFLSLIFINRFHNIIENEISHSYQQVLDQYENNVIFKLETFQNLMEGIASNTLVQEVFIKQDDSAEADVYSLSSKFKKEIDTLIFKKAASDITTIIIYALDESFPTDGYHISNIKHIKDEPWYSEIEKSQKLYYYFYYVTPGQKKQVISIVRPIFDLSGSFAKKKIGYIKVDINAQRILSISNINQKDSFRANFILDSTGQVIYNSTQTHQIQNSKTGDDYNSTTRLEDVVDIEAGELHSILQNDEGMDIVKRNGNKEIVIYHKMNGYDWKCIFFFPYSEIEKSVLETGMFILTIVACLLAVFIGLTILFSRFFSNRIEMFVRKIQKVEEGNLEIKNAIEGQDEIGIIDRHFNRMVQKLKQSINETYTEQIERREAELTALQSQINPHFLYNTLEFINSIASINGVDDISVICQKLGEMFRYNINIGRDKFVTLEEELKHIRNYIFIQQVRFAGKFEVFYDVPEYLQNCQVLKFILQPIVENAFFHGFSGNPDEGCLEISVRREGQDIILRIQDDGAGMTDEQVSYLTDYINRIDKNVLKNFKGSIGIKNVNSRIKLTYGERYGIRIISKLNEGTGIIITLPLYDYKEAEDDVQDIGG